MPDTLLQQLHEASDKPVRYLQYEFGPQIGLGGMGVVFEVRDTQLNRTVAIKILKAELAGSSRERERFVQESQALAAVKHPNVVTVHAVDEAAPLMVMERLHGESLAVYLDRHGRLEPREAVRIAASVADGLQAAHDSGLIHRDVKPENIWLEPRTAGSEDYVVKLLDFGLAESFDSLAARGEGRFAGTPTYASPEQIRNEPLCSRTDLYSLGIVLYRMLAGSLPLAGASRAKILVSIVTQDLPDLPPELPDSLRPLVRSLTNRSVEQRFAAAADAAVALRMVQQELDAGWAERLRRSLATGEGWLAVAAALIPALLVWLGLSAMAQPGLVGDRGSHVKPSALPDPAAARSTTEPQPETQPQSTRQPHIMRLHVANRRLKITPMAVGGSSTRNAVALTFGLPPLRETTILDAKLELPKEILATDDATVSLFAPPTSASRPKIPASSRKLDQLLEQGKLVSMASTDREQTSFEGFFEDGNSIGLADAELLEFVRSSADQAVLFVEYEKRGAEIPWEADTQLIIETLSGPTKGFDPDNDGAANE